MHISHDLHQDHEWSCCYRHVLEWVSRIEHNMVFWSGILSCTALKETNKPATTTAGIAQVGCEDLIQRTLTFQSKFDSLLKPSVNEGNMLQFLIPPPSKMDMSGDLVSNWEFFRDSCQNYATATKLADKDKKIVAADNGY